MEPCICCFSDAIRYFDLYSIHLYLKRSFVRKSTTHTWFIISYFYFKFKARIESNEDHGPEVIKLVPCSTHLSMKFILPMNAKMPTIVGILTFISMINTTSERLKVINVLICQYFSFNQQLKSRAQLSWAWIKFYNLGPDQRVSKMILIVQYCFEIFCFRVL